MIGSEKVKRVVDDPPRVQQMMLDGTMLAEKHGGNLLILPEAIELMKKDDN